MKKVKNASPTVKDEKYYRRLTLKVLHKKKLLEILKSYSKKHISTNSCTISLCGCLRQLCDKAIFSLDDAFIISKLLFEDKSIKRYEKNGNFWKPNLIKPRIEWIEKEIMESRRMLLDYSNRVKGGIKRGNI